jgi:hypothetical protein
MMKEKISESSQGEEEEEHTVEMLTQWEIELRMLEDWLDNPEPADGCQKTVMQISRRRAFDRIAQNFQPGS